MVDGWYLAFLAGAVWLSSREAWKAGLRVGYARALRDHLEGAKEPPKVGRLRLLK